MVAELTAARPFAWTFEGAGPADVVDPVDPAVLNGPRVTQCALSRVCGVCAMTLGRPVAFLGPEDEVGRNAFHAPPLHLECAEAVRATLAPDWQLVTTSGFEFVRANREDADRRPTFQPNSLL